MRSIIETQRTAAAEAEKRLADSREWRPQAAVTFGTWSLLMRGFSFFPSHPTRSLAHLLARFLMRFGEMINAAIGEALMDEEEEAEEEEEDVGSWNCFC